MEARATLHPTDQTLSYFGLGKLDDASAESVSKHLEQCPGCRKRVAEMPDDSFLGRFRGAPVMDHLMSGPSEPGASQSVAGAGAPAPPPASTLPPGLADHADYEIKRELGRGGMGVVYLAHNRLMGRDEVLKVVSSHVLNREGVLDRFLREIRSAAKLHHANIVTAYSALRPGGSLVLSMEYVEGYDLSQLVKAKGPLSVAQACIFVHQAALGLQHAHERGMVHRDIKPSNLMLAREGDKPVIKVLDFGLAKFTSEGLAESGLTHEGQMLGTPDYIAPEQIRDARSADIRADIYSLGCTLYHLLSGRPPFHGDSLWDLYQAHFSMDASPLNLLRPEVPVELAALVAKMMAKEPERRFQTPGEVAKALVPFFKKANVASQEARPEISQFGAAAAKLQTAGASPPSPQPATNPEQAAAFADKKPAMRPQPAWEGLIQVKVTEPHRKPAAALVVSKRPTPPWMRPTAAAAVLLFGLGIALAVQDFRGKDAGNNRPSPPKREKQPMPSAGGGVTASPLAPRQVEVRESDYKAKVAVDGGRRKAEAAQPAENRPVQPRGSEAARTSKRTAIEGLEHKPRTPAAALPPNGRVSTLPPPRTANGNTGPTVPAIKKDVMAFDGRTRVAVAAPPPPVAHTPPAPGRPLPPPDPAPPGSLWVGRRLFSDGHLQDCELKITSRDKTRLAGVITLWDPAAKDERFTVNFNGDIDGGIVTFRSERSGQLQQNFVGELRGQLMQLKWNGTTRRGTPAQGTAVLRHNEARTEQAPPGPKAPMEEVVHVPIRPWYNPIAFSPDSERVAIDNFSGIKVVELKTGKLLSDISPERPVVGNRNCVVSIDIATSGLIIAAYEDQMIRLWDPAGPRKVRELGDEPQGDRFTDLKYSQKWKWVVGRTQNEIRFWDLETGRVLKPRAPAAPLTGMDLHPNGQWIASIHDDHVIRIWDALTGNPVIDAFPDASKKIVRVRYSHDGRQLLCLPRDAGEFYSVNPENGEVITTFPGVLANVVDAAFLRSDRRVASIHADNIFRVWSVNTGAFHYWKAYAKELRSLGISPDGRYLVILLAGEAIVYRLRD